MSYVETFHMYFDQVFLPAYNNIFEEWKGFREYELWTLDVNKIFVANFHGLRNLYGVYAKKTSKKKQVLRRNLTNPEFMSIDDAIQMVTYDSDLQINYV